MRLTRNGARSSALALTLALMVACSDAGEGTPQAGGGSGVGAAGSGSSGGPAWCDVQQVLEAKCQRCHLDPPLHGAPFPLVTFEHTQVSEASGKLRWQSMQNVVMTGFMPPDFVKLDPPVEKLTPTETDLLLAWFNGGALAPGGLSCTR